MRCTRSAYDLPFVRNDLLEAIAHATVEVLAWNRHAALDLSTYSVLDMFLLSWSNSNAYTLVLTTSSGYITRISETPATAPAANWYMKGSGLSVDMMAAA